MMRDELKDRAISLLKDTYAIGYEDGVKATNVDCGVVWEDRIFLSKLWLPYVCTTGK